MNSLISNEWLPIDQFDPDMHGKVFICDKNDKWIGAVLTYWTSSWTGKDWDVNIRNPTCKPIIPTHFFPLYHPPLPE